MPTQYSTLEHVSRTGILSGSSPRIIILLPNLWQAQQLSPPMNPFEHATNRETSLAASLEHGRDVYLAYLNNFSY